MANHLHRFVSGGFREERGTYILDQSVHDSRCTVRLGAKNELFSLSKWGGKASLVFGKDDDWAGTVRCAGTDLVLAPYAKERSRYVFRKLDGDRFEYDVVLLAEPESNVIPIDISFPDGLTFYRQPSADYMRLHRMRCDPSVIDSYAVYWKERNGAYKTGKFCHIYRPRITDARGRAVWGSLAIAGSRLLVTIPEDWLAEASYPVVVDPVIGTPARGALNTIDWYDEGVPVPFGLDVEMGLGRFMASEHMAGSCTAYIYAYLSGGYSGQAVLYADDDGVPGARLSRDETITSLDATMPSWYGSRFTLSEDIGEEQMIWFGYNAKTGLATYYDVGGTFKKMWTDTYPGVPELFSDTGDTWNIIMSAYCAVNPPATISRTVTGSAGITSIPSRKGNWIRGMGDSVSGRRTSQRVLAARRRVHGELAGSALCSGWASFIRVLSGRVNVLFGITQFTRIVRLLKGKLNADRGIRHSAYLFRKPFDAADACGVRLHTKRVERLLSDAITGVVATVTSWRRVSRLVTGNMAAKRNSMRKVTAYRHNVSGVGASGNWIHSVRALRRIPGLIGMVLSSRHSAVGVNRYCAGCSDVSGPVSRRLFAVRMVQTLCGLREFFHFRRFLGKEELVIVSRVTRELEIRSTVV